MHKNTTNNNTNTNTNTHTHTTNLVGFDWGCCPVCGEKLFEAGKSPLHEEQMKKPPVGWCDRCEADTTRSRGEDGRFYCDGCEYATSPVVLPELPTKGALLEAVKSLPLGVQAYLKERHLLESNALIDHALAWGVVCRHTPPKRGKDAREMVENALRGVLPEPHAGVKFIDSLSEEDFASLSLIFTAKVKVLHNQVADHICGLEKIEDMVEDFAVWMEDAKCMESIMWVRLTREFKDPNEFSSKPHALYLLDCIEEMKRGLYADLAKSKAGEDVKAYLESSLETNLFSSWWCLPVADNKGDYMWWPLRRKDFMAWWEGKLAEFPSLATKPQLNPPREAEKPVAVPVDGLELAVKEWKVLAFHAKDGNAGGVIAAYKVIAGESPYKVVHIPRTTDFFINLTPHEIVVQMDGKVVKFPPSGQVARVETTKPLVVAPVHGIEVCTTSEPVGVVGMPSLEECKGKMLLVSAFVGGQKDWLLANGYIDVFGPDTSPQGAIRNDKGHVVAVKRLVRFT